MKTKKFKNGKSLCKSYCRKVGQGWEVGFTFGSKPIFVGNFVHQKEANAFYTRMNRDLRKFGKKYKVGPTYPTAWFRRFLTHHLYKSYYTYVNKLIPLHTRKFTTALNRDERRYKQLKRRARAPMDKPFFKAA